MSLKGYMVVKYPHQHNYHTICIGSYRFIKLPLARSEHYSGYAGTQLNVPIPSLVHVATYTCIILCTCNSYTTTSSTSFCLSPAQIWSSPSSLYADPASVSR